MEGEYADRIAGALEEISARMDVQTLMMARMVDALELQALTRVLEMAYGGSGSLGHGVYAIERTARAILEKITAES